MGVVWDILESLFSSLGNEVSRRTGDTINRAYKQAGNDSEKIKRIDEYAEQREQALENYGQFMKNNFHKEKNDDDF